MNRQFRNAYRNALAVEVEAASPHKLILMLFDGALQAIAQAERQIEQKNIAEKGRLISKAISIVDEGLRAGLRLDQGGELAANLDALYDYTTRQLLRANLENNVMLLQEVAGLLGQIREAWVQIESKPQPASNEAPTQRTDYGAA